MTFERDFKCRSAMLCAEPFAKASEPLFFLFAAKRISADRREHLCHHGCLREIALLFAPIYFFSAYGEAKRISEKLGFAEIRYRLCLGFALGRGSCVKLRCRNGKRQVVVHDFVVAKVKIARNINAACVGIPL